MATTTRAIAKEAGISRGALQHHFQSFDDLIFEIVGGEITERLHFRWSVDDLGTKNLEERIDIVLQHYYDVFSSPIFFAVIPALINSAPAFRRRINKRLLGLQTSINALWRRIFDDVPISDKEVESVRRVAMGAIRGLALRDRYGESGAWAADSVTLREMILYRLNLGANHQVIDEMRTASRRLK